MQLDAIIYFSHLYQCILFQAPWTIQSRRPSIGWPRTGTVEFQSYKTRYRDGLELTLKGITCNIRSGEKVGPYSMNET